MRPNSKLFLVILGSQKIYLIFLQTVGFNLDRKLPNDDKCNMNDSSVNNGLTGVVSINKSTIVTNILKQCDALKENRKHS